LQVLDGKHDDGAPGKREEEARVCKKGKEIWAKGELVWVNGLGLREMGKVELFDKGLGDTGGGTQMRWRTLDGGGSWRRCDGATTSGFNFGVRTCCDLEFRGVDTLVDWVFNRTRIGDIVAKGYQGLLRYEGLAKGEVRELLWEKRAAAEGDGEALGVREKLCERERATRGGKECNREWGFVCKGDRATRLDAIRGL
ncbi:hypothetical protein Drorol1_Dr00012323, partial [Drosera rotundifolia]